MTLSIIIVNYNTKKLLMKCLQRIADNLQLPRSEVEVIVVDNNSSDGSEEYLKKLRVTGYELRVIQNYTNVGFGSAVNQGIKTSSGDYVLLLNTDTELQEGSVKTLIDFVRNNQNIGIVVPQLLNPDGSIQPSCFKYPTIGGAIRKFWLGQNEAFGKYIPEGNQPNQVEGAVGAVWLMPRLTIERVGLLNEKFFMYYEDIDYCRRTRQAGLKIVYIPQLKVIHLHGASGKKLADKPNQWLVESSKKYHGLLEHYLINLIIRISQLCQK